MLRGRLRGGVAIIAASGLLVGTAGGAAGQVEVQPTLYERIGGVYRIAAVADDFIDRMLDDQVVAANPYIQEAKGRVLRPGLKYQVTSMLCSAAGGPERYGGLAMGPAHAHLRITGREWEAAVADFRASLEQLEIGAAEGAELLRIVAGVRAEIITAGELDGRVFAGELGEKAKSSGAREEIRFANGRLHSTTALARGFTDAIYVAHPEGETTSFMAQASDPVAGTVSWMGTVKGGTLEAVVTWAKPSGAPTESWVRASGR